MSEYLLIKKIIDNSEIKQWDKAKLEWELSEVWYSQSPDSCACGYFPINEICEIVNVKNKNALTVGNCCVKKFIGLSSDLIFQAKNRVTKDNEKSFNIETIDFAHKKGWINNWEYEFYADIMRKRKFSDKQLSKKVQINIKVLQYLNRKGGQTSALE
jgi:hypothetical protein